MEIYKWNCGAWKKEAFNVLKAERIERRTICF